MELIIKLEEDTIMVLNNRTKSNKILIKTIQHRERTLLVYRQTGVTFNATAIFVAGGIITQQLLNADKHSIVQHYYRNILEGINL